MRLTSSFIRFNLLPIVMYFGFYAQLSYSTMGPYVICLLQTMAMYSLSTFIYSPSLIIARCTICLTFPNVPISKNYKKIAMSDTSPIYERKKKHFQLMLQLVHGNMQHNMDMRLLMLAVSSSTKPRSVECELEQKKKLPRMTATVSTLAHRVPFVDIPSNDRTDGIIEYRKHELKKK